MVRYTRSLPARRRSSPKRPAYGVAANPELRHAYEAMCHQIGVRLTMPPLSACTDNAAMIALVALDRYKQGKFFGLDCDVKAHAPLDEAY